MFQLNFCKVFRAAPLDKLLQFLSRFIILKNLHSSKLRPDFARNSAYGQKCQCVEFRAKKRASTIFNALLMRETPVDYREIR
jgi:hypothetical protein